MADKPIETFEELMQMFVGAKFVSAEFDEDDDFVVTFDDHSLLAISADDGYLVVKRYERVPIAKWH